MSTHVPSPAPRTSRRSSELYTLRCVLVPPTLSADGIFTPQWYNVVDHVNSDMTFRVALAKALAASTVYAPFANGMFLAGARVLRHGIKVCSRRARACASLEKALAEESCTGVGNAVCPHCNADERCAFLLLLLLL